MIQPHYGLNICNVQYIYFVCWFVSNKRQTAEPIEPTYRYECKSAESTKFQIFTVCWKPNKENVNSFAIS